MMRIFSVFLLVHALTVCVHGFSAPSTTGRTTQICHPSFWTTRSMSSSPSPAEGVSSNDNKDETEERQAEEQSKLDQFLSKKYPSFYKMLLNDKMKKVVAAAGSGKGRQCTVFVPNAKAFEELGTKKMKQLEDPRNAEIREKMGSYHIIENESVSAVELLTEDWTKVKPGENKPNTVVASIITMSGQVPVGRGKSQDGLLGLFSPPKEDGDIVIGPSAKIVQSFIVDNNYVHEVDSFISPVILWRYCDQLRIPGF